MRTRQSAADEPGRAIACAVRREIGPVICSANAIETLNAGHRRAVETCGHLPNEQAAMTCLTLSPDPSTPPDGPSPMDKCPEPALNAFALTFGDRWPAAAVTNALGSARSRA